MKPSTLECDIDHGKCFQDAPDLSQLETGLVAKAKQIQQKATLSQVLLQDNFAPGPFHNGDRTILSPKKVHGDLILEMAEKMAQFREIHHLNGTRK